MRAPPYSCPKWGLGAEEICGTRDVSQAWGECIARSDIRVPEAKRGRVPCRNEGEYRLPSGTTKTEPQTTSGMD